MTIPPAADALPQSDPPWAPRRRLRWLWPAIAFASLLSTGVMSVALLRRPPQPTLLPSAPPEKDVRAAHLPARVQVPAEGDAAPAAANAARAATTTNRGKPTPTAPVRKKHPHATRRAG